MLTLLRKRSGGSRIVSCIESNADSIVLRLVVVRINSWISFECLECGLNSKINDMSHIPHVSLLTVNFHGCSKFQALLSAAVTSKCSRMTVLLDALSRVSSEDSSCDVKVVGRLYEEPREVLSRAD